ncbi:MAG: hypothetical protein IPF99_37075 [Deltaproteobacteria bacterium]|nr:hypothetical protein [Deltaproteobacteria bacterium]
MAGRPEGASCRLGRGSRVAAHREARRSLRHAAALPRDAAGCGEPAPDDTVDASVVDASVVDVRAADVPAVDVPAVDVPAVDVPAVDVPPMLLRLRPSGWLMAMPYRGRSR